MLTATMMVALMTSADPRLLAQEPRVTVGMTLRQAEAVLKEAPTTFMLSGGVPGANVYMFYATKKVWLSFGADGKVNRVMRAK